VIDRITTLASGHQLMVMGVAHRTVLLGPTGPGFWTAFQDSPEWRDGLPDPMDRWSTRVIGAMALELGANAVFPFGPDAGNFLQLAMDSDAAWQSPVGMLVHADAGLMVSYRGALVFDAPLYESPKEKPCDTCAQPCITACPVGALTPAGYDVPRCHAFLKTPDGADCLQAGCLVRRACPVSQAYGRDAAQSGYHMGRFLK